MGAEHASAGNRAGSEIQQTRDQLQVWLARMRFASTTFVSLYLLFLLLLTIPFIQTHTVYMNAVKLPWFAKFDRPEDYGTAPGKTTNLQLTTPDNETLGAWFLLSDIYYRSQPFPPPSIPSLESVQTAIRLKPTILFFHGQAATRAAHFRVAHYQAFSARLETNVFAIDYRGFADSSGTPSEDGLAIDARTAWDWLVHNGAREEDILIVGQSLGTSVAARLAGELSGEEVKYRGVVLLSPFSSIEALLTTYSILWFFPVMKPLSAVPGAHAFISKALYHKFNTLDAFDRITRSTLIAHAEDDRDIPHSHADTLFKSILEPHLPEIKRPPQNALDWKIEDWTEFESVSVRRKERRESLVTMQEIKRFGALQNLTVDERRVALLKTYKGGHNKLGLQEGVHDVMRMMFDL